MQHNNLLLNTNTCLKLNQFISILLQWNATYRLVGDSSPQTVWDKHITDAIVLSLQLAHAIDVVDLGAGAGLPAIPLKILRPDLFVCLVESQRKRINFCEACVRQLGLKNIMIIRGRAEDRAVISRVGRRAVVMSRATWALDEFVSMATPYLDSKGTLVAFKGKEWARESHNTMLPIKLLLPYCISASHQERAIIFFTA